jgi:hypothetical protein
MQKSMMAANLEKEPFMIALHTGQCGLCAHFGEPHPATPTLIQIHDSKQAPETFLDDCGHPKHAPLHLKVSAMSGCDGFTPAAAA